MKKSILSVLNFFSILVFLTGSLSAQVLPSTLHVKLEDAMNAEALVQTGNIRKAADGGYLIAGTRGNGEFARAVLVKTDADFEPLWSHRLDQTLTFGNSWQASYGMDVIELGNDEYAFLAGVNMNVFSNSPVLQNLDYGFVRFKRTSGGNIVQAANRFGTDFNEVPHGMIRTEDGGFMLCGYSNLEQALNLPSKALTFLVKLDEDGNQEWARRYRNQAGSCNTSGLGVFLGMMRRNVIETQDGGYVFTMHCDENVYITKVNNAGEELWSKTFASSTGFSDGASNDLGAIGVAAGAGGTIIGVREMPNGDLAFLGNHFAYFIALLILDGNSNGAGLFLPFSYVFTTDPTGNFKKGAAFFHERFNDPNMPVEMMASEFEVLPNGNFMIAGGVDQFGNTYYRPAFFELDIDQQEIDQSVLSAASIGNDLPIFYANDNSRGMSNIKMSYDIEKHEIGLSYNMKHNFKISDYYGYNAAIGCLEAVNNMHSFSFVLDLADYEMLASDISGGAFVPEVNNLEVNRLINCAAPPVAVENIPETAVETIAAIVPTINDGRFNIVLRDADWTGAGIVITDMTGRVIYRGQATGMVNEIQDVDLSSGMYIVMLRKEEKQAVLRTVVVKN